MTPIQRLSLVILLACSVAATIWLLLYGGSDTLVAAFRHSYDWVQQHQLAALLFFFVISFVSQLIVMPSGSLMLLLAGFALGALPAASVFAVAQVLSAWPVYALSKRVLKPVEQGFLQGTDQRRIGKVLDKLSSLKGNQTMATVVLRLTPVIPSAGACLLAAVCGIALRPFLIGTLLTCWIRPLFFASSGAAMSSVLIAADVNDALSRLDVTPLLLLFIAALTLFLVTRRLSG